MPWDVLEAFVYDCAQRDSILVTRKGIFVLVVDGWNVFQLSCGGGEILGRDLG
jgi:hypothetical protein